MGEEIAANFEWFADWASDRSLLYERLARGVIDEPELLDLVQETRAGQPEPNLLFGAVHALLLDGAQHPLSEYYPTCVDEPRNPADDDLFEQFKSFCQAHREQIREIVSTRRVQTNDVGRSVILLPSFTHVSRNAQSDRLALVEIGASAGLNLYWDRFRYDYDGAVCGDPDSPVEIRSEIRGEGQPPLPASLPPVADRVGIDLNPLSVTDATDRNWLRALVLPDQQYRHERLAAAIQLVRSDPPRLVAGDVLDVLPDVLETLPDETARCVYSTITLYQFEDEALARLREQLREASYHRPIHWLSGDPASPTDEPTYRYIVFENGEESETNLGTFTAHGEWIRWQAE